MKRRRERAVRASRVSGAGRRGPRDGKDAMDVVRALFRAINDNDADTAAALYDAECQIERVFPEVGEYCVGRESARSGWARLMAERAGGLPGSKQVGAGCAPTGAA